MPSYSEVCTICNLKSKNTAHTVIRKLIALGKIDSDSSGKLIPKEKELGLKSKQTPRETLVPKSEYTPLTVLGLVEAGFPTPSEESLHEQISLDDWIIKKREASFMLRVSGDSMKDAGILHDDMVIVERTSTPKVGQIVVAEVDGSYTLKYLRKNNSGVYYLEPANKAFPLIYPKEDLAVKAVVLAVVRKYNV